MARYGFRGAGKTASQRSSIPFLPESRSWSCDMAGVLVDTNVLIRYFRGDEPFAEFIETAESVVVHPVVYAEYLNGLDESKKGAKLLRRRLEEFIDAPAVALANISTTTSLYYSKIYKALKGSGRMIPQNDIWIAASAIEKGYILATHDEHFSQIPMLRLVE